MAVLFSAVTLTADNNQVEFLAAGVPRDADDLEGWTAYHPFVSFNNGVFRRNTFKSVGIRSIVCAVRRIFRRHICKNDIVFDIRVFGLQFFQRLIDEFIKVSVIADIKKIRAVFFYQRSYQTF